MAAGPDPGRNSGRLDGWEVLATAAEMARRDEEFALATVVWRQAPSSGHTGSRAVITASGQIFGWTSLAMYDTDTGDTLVVITNSTGSFDATGAPVAPDSTVSVAPDDSPVVV